MNDLYNDIHLREAIHTGIPIRWFYHLTNITRGAPPLYPWEQKLKTYHAPLGLEASNNSQLPRAPWARWLALEAGLDNVINNTILP